MQGYQEQQEKREPTKEELKLLLEQSNEIIRRLQEKIGKNEGYITRLELENEALKAHFQKMNENSIETKKEDE